MKKIAPIFLSLLIILTLFYFIRNSHNQQIDRLELEIEKSHKEKQLFIDSLNHILDGLNQTLDSLPLGPPIKDSIVVSSDYGWRRNPLTAGWGFHPGLDIHAWIYDTIYATGIGLINSASWKGGYGKCITINHISGYQSYYAHLYKYFVKRGDTVYKGQPIGRAGNSGEVTGPHLHYEIRRNGLKTDPLPYISLGY